MKKLIAALLLLVGITTLPAVPSYALSPAQTFASGICDEGVLTFVPWSKGLIEKNGACQPTKLNDVWIIVLNIFQDVLIAATYMTVGFIIWGGIKYMKSQGAPDQIQGAKNTILEAAIGLGIVLASVAIVNFVSKALAG